MGRGVGWGGKVAPMYESEKFVQNRGKEKKIYRKLTEETIEKMIKKKNGNKMQHLKYPFSLSTVLTDKAGKWTLLLMGADAMITKYT